MAQIVGPGETPTKRIRLGEDIQSMQCSSDGSIWVGYGDIGCMISKTNAKQGIARFRPSGKRVWGFNSDKTIKKSFVDTAECLNVSKWGIYSVIWPGYVIVELGVAKPKFLRSRMESANCLATDGHSMLLMDLTRHGSANDLVSAAILGPPAHASSRKSRRIWSGHIAIPKPIKSDMVAARGDTLHHVKDQKWMSLSLKDALAQVRS